MMRGLMPLALILSVTACVEDVGTDQVKAQVEEPPPPRGTRARRRRR